MSEGKNKKKKVIHVDELVVKADKVIFVNDRDSERRPPRDPWGGLFPRRAERDAQSAENEQEDNQQEEPGQEEQRRGWRWI